MSTAEIKQFLLMKVDYFQAQNIIQHKTFPCYIITGNEAFQHDHLIQIIHGVYQSKNFEIIKAQTTPQNHAFLYHNHNALSLFATKRLLQITFTQAADKNIQKALMDISEQFHSDDHYLFIFNEITQAQQKSKWFQMLTKQGLHIHLYPATTKDTFKILKLIIKRNKNIQVTDDAMMLIASKTEGNLAAANHIISLLTTQPETTFDSNNIVNFLADFMRYDVFDLAQSITCQQPKRALTIAHYLLQQTEPAIILWAIVKEIRLWILLSNQNPIEQQKTFKANTIWHSKQSAYIALLQRFKQQDLKKFMNTCLNIDLMIKGAISGNIKQSLIALIGDLTVMHSNNHGVVKQKPPIQPTVTGN